MIEKGNSRFVCTTQRGKNKLNILLNHPCGFGTVKKTKTALEQPFTEISKDRYGR